VGAAVGVLFLTVGLGILSWITGVIRFQPNAGAEGQPTPTSGPKRSATDDKIALDELDRQQIATCDKICEMSSTQMFLIEKIYLAEAQAKANRIQLNAKTDEEKFLAPSMIDEVMAKARVDTLKDSKYQEYQDIHTTHAKKFRDVLRQHPEWGGTYGSRPWARGN
jgi:hypothetical protein